MTIDRHSWAVPRGPLQTSPTTKGEGAIPTARPEEAWRRYWPQAEPDFLAGMPPPNAPPARVLP